MIDINMPLCRAGKGKRLHIFVAGSIPRCGGYGPDCPIREVGTGSPTCRLCIQYNEYDRKMAA
jgi:hypothetical protein